MSECHRLSPFCGKNLSIDGSGVVKRIKNQANNAICFTALPLVTDELFEVAVKTWAGQWAGSIAIGVTLMNPDDKLPSTIAGIKSETWYISGKNYFICEV